MTQTVTTDAGRLLMAERLFDVLTHLAVGTGGWPATPAAATGLVAEIGRVRYLERRYVVEDPTGPLVVAGGVYREVTGPSHLIYLRFQFAADEAVGNWSEFGLFGGAVEYISRSAVLSDGPQAGDDRANVDVILVGTYAPNENQTLTVTCTTGGGSPQIGWTSTGSLPSGSAAVTFNAPVALGASGLSLIFTGGVDDVLTLNDRWVIRCTRAAESPEYAAGGIYDPVLNEDGQVKTAGTLVRLDHESPAVAKGAVVTDVLLVLEVGHG